MKPFRFRAASALDLRKRQEDEARAREHHAQKVASVAASAAENARLRVAAAQAGLAAVQSTSAPAWLIGWHRSWIATQTKAADAARREADKAALAAAHAAEITREAFKKRRVLERLRDRLAARHARDAERLDLSQMNELAGMRYLAAIADQKEQS